MYDFEVFPQVLTAIIGEINYKCVGPDIYLFCYLIYF
jgi:hypothetical protein